VLRRRSVREGGVAFLAYTAIAFIELWPLIHHLGSSVLYGATDSTGTLRDYWVMGHLGQNPFTFSHDPYNGAPEGYPRSPALSVANAVQPALIWATKGLFGLVASWNLLTISGFVLSAVAAFLLLRYLGMRPVTGFIGGYVFGFGPWMFDRAYAGHAGMQQLWILPLLFGVCVWLHRSRMLRGAAFVGVCLAVAMYLHSYIGLMAGVIAVSFYLLELAVATDRLRTLYLGGTSMVVALLLFAPPLYMYVRDSSSVSGRVSEPLSDLYTNGATLRDYLLPSARNPLLGSLRPIHLEGEHLLFFGYVTLVLAALGTWLVLRNRKNAEDHWLALFALTVVVLAAFTSLKPTMQVGPVSIPTPSDAIGRVVSFWRVYARVGIDVGLGLIVLSAFAYEWLLRRRRGLVYVAALACVLVVELTVRLPVPTWSTSTVLPHIRWLSEHPGGIVANYPLPIERPTLDLGAREYWYQTLDGHPLFAQWGGNHGGTREDAIRIVASDLSDPNVAGVLAAERVRYVVVHDDVYRAEGASPPKLDSSYRLVARTSDDVRIYTVSAKAVNLADYLLDQSQRIAAARAYPAPDAGYGGGFNPPEAFSDGRQWRWMTQNGDVDVKSVTPGRYLLVLDAFSNAAPRTLTLIDAQGHRLGVQSVSTARQTLTFGPFQLNGPTTLNLVATPGPVQLSQTDTRQASVFVSPFELRPAPDFYGDLNG
jgi:hypothetical protein